MRGSVIEVKFITEEETTLYRIEGWVVAGGVCNIIISLNRLQCRLMLVSE